MEGIRTNYYINQEWDVTQDYELAFEEYVVGWEWTDSDETMLQLYFANREDMVKYMEATVAY